MKLNYSKQQSTRRILSKLYCVVSRALVEVFYISLLSVLQERDE